MTGPLEGWTPRPAPPLTPMRGRCVIVEPFDPRRHGEALHRALCADPAADEAAAVWRYLPPGPYPDAASMTENLLVRGRAGGWVMYVLRPDGGAPAGTMSYLRVRPADGSAELGMVVLGPRLQRTTAASEAVFLMAARVFDDLGYRRFEWKCDAANTRSMRAAVRFGFTFEGVFRQDQVARGRNRDTAWFSILDREWPVVKAGFETWLDPANFDADGRARIDLETARAAAGAAGCNS